MSSLLENYILYLQLKLNGPMQSKSMFMYWIGTQRMMRKFLKFIIDWWMDKTPVIKCLRCDQIADTCNWAEQVR